jgi:hypothetical protein
MTEVEANEAIQMLTETLELKGFGWLAQEAAGAVQEGKTQQKVRVKRSAIRLLENATAEETPKRQGSEFTRRVAYSPQEHLALLVKAIVNLIGDSASMNAALVKEFGTITFEPERIASDPTGFVIDEQSAKIHEEVRERVVKHATELGAHK